MESMGIVFFQSLREALYSLKEDELLYVSSRSIVSPISIIYKRDDSSGKYVEVGVETVESKLRYLKYTKTGVYGSPGYFCDRCGFSILAEKLPTFAFLKSDLVNSTLSNVLEAVEVNKDSFDKEFREAIFSSFSKLITRKPFLVIRDLKTSEEYAPEVKKIAKDVFNILLGSFGKPPQDHPVKLQIDESSPIFKDFLEHFSLMVNDIKESNPIQSHNIKFFDEFIGEKGCIWGEVWFRGKSIDGIDISESKYSYMSSTVKRLVGKNYEEHFEKLEEEEALKILPKRLFSLNIEHEDIGQLPRKKLGELDLFLVPLEYKKDEAENIRVDLLVMFKIRIKDASLSIHIVEKTQNTPLPYSRSILNRISYRISDIYSKKPMATARILKHRKGERKGERGEVKRVSVEVDARLELRVSLQSGLESKDRSAETGGHPEVDTSYISIRKDVKREFSHYFLLTDERQIPIYLRDRKEDLIEEPEKWYLVNMMINRAFIEKFLPKKVKDYLPCDLSGARDLIKEGILKSLKNLEEILKDSSSGERDKGTSALLLAKEVLSSLANKIGKEDTSLEGRLYLHNQSPEKLGKFSPNELGEVDEETARKIKDLLPRVVSSEDIYLDSIKNLGREGELLLKGTELCAGIGGKTTKIFPLGFKGLYQDEGADVFSKALYLSSLSTVMGNRRNKHDYYDDNDDKEALLESGTEIGREIYKMCLLLSAQTFTSILFNQENPPMFISSSKLKDLVIGVAQSMFKSLLIASGYGKPGDSIGRLLKSKPGEKSPLINLEKALRSLSGFKFHINSSFYPKIEVGNKKSSVEGDHEVVGISYDSFSSLILSRNGEIAILFPTKSREVEVGFYIAS